MGLGNGGHFEECKFAGTHGIHSHATNQGPVRLYDVHSGDPDVVKPLLHLVPHLHLQRCSPKPAWPV